MPTLLNFSFKRSIKKINKNKSLAKLSKLLCNTSESPIKNNVTVKQHTENGGALSLSRLKK